MSHLQRPLSAWLPITKKEVEDRGWGELDVILITGDAYIELYKVKDLQLQ
jgi:hypothetical protein